MPTNKKQLTVKINNLSFNCIIGILQKERKIKQKVVIQCEYKYVFKNKEFIDYSKVANDIKTIMKKKKFLLLEDAVLYIYKRLSTKYNTIDFKIEIEKPTILKNCQVSLSL